MPPRLHVEASKFLTQAARGVCIRAASRCVSVALCGRVDGALPCATEGSRRRFCPPDSHTSTRCQQPEGLSNACLSDVHHTDKKMGGKRRHDAPAKKQAHCGSVAAR